MHSGPPPDSHPHPPLLRGAKVLFSSKPFQWGAQRPAHTARSCDDGQGRRKKASIRGHWGKGSIGAPVVLFFRVKIGGCAAGEQERSGCPAGLLKYASAVAVGPIWAHAPNVSRTWVGSSTRCSGPVSRCSERVIHVTRRGTRSHAYRQPRLEGAAIP